MRLSSLAISKAASFIKALYRLAGRTMPTPFVISVSRKERDMSRLAGGACFNAA